MAGRVSLKPSEAIEGGIVPVDRNLTWKTNKFTLFDYVNKAGTVVATAPALAVTYVDDDGTESLQHYSAGSMDRFLPSKDGEFLEAQGDAQAISKSSNLYYLMNALVNAGFPEDKLGELPASALNGMKTYNIGMPEPKRPGLKREAGADERERVISVPSKIISLPWDKKGGKAPATKGAATTETAADPTEDALAIVADVLKDSDSATRQAIATRAIRAKKPAVAKFVFTDEFQVALLSGGYTLDGDNITKS